ncbi:C3H1-type domain-containing protein [Pleurotus pulmonarius]
MASTAASEAELRNEIARLTASINYHKAGQPSAPSSTAYSRTNAYVNPRYQGPPATKYIRPTYPVPRPISSSTLPVSNQPKEVVLGGVAFKSSGRSLVRKGLPTPPPANFVTAKKPGHVPPPIKARPIPRRRAPPGKRNRNMTLNNTNQSRRNSKRARKYINKPCPRFTTTGSCNRGLTCMYQHDPAKIAICWNFLQGSCTNTASSCHLSHDPIPERTPICVHFLNKGRCTRENCPFPHVNVGAREGICRDFAVLGFCEKGLDCDKQHVRECPDFAEQGSCTTKRCKLPHVIRANRNRKVDTNASKPGPAAASVVASSTATDLDLSPPHLTAEKAQLGDEFISLTFNESESSDEESEDDSEAEASDGDEPEDTEMQED